MRTLIVAVSAAAVAAKLSMPQLQGLQGQDDQTMADYCHGLGDNDVTLTRRYANIERDLQPGVRRYNAFWSGAEPNPPSATPMSCPSGYLAIPANESDRIARGFNLYHCYSEGFLTAFDDYFARDAAIGAASALIMYGSPSWAIVDGCTGFPWGPNMYTQGCLPWYHLDSWEDYVNTLVNRWHAPWGSGLPRISGMVIWNEVQSQGWADPSPIIRNRYNGTGWSPSEYQLYASMLANITLAMARASSRWMDDMTLWLSTDHFMTPPPLNKGDVMHIGLTDLLQYLFPLLNTSINWSVAVHPYDAGDPRQNLTSQGIYTFATLRENVAAQQCTNLQQYSGVAPDLCWEYPQTQMWASEQGWPFNNVTMNKTLQARNICYAHGLSMAQGLWAVTHNFFQGSAPSSQGDAGDFSLIDELPVVSADLSTGPGHDTYDAYMATAPGVYGVRSDHYCCTRWGWGCANMATP